jgi:hypothetical protein
MLRFREDVRIEVLENNSRHVHEETCKICPKIKRSPKCANCKKARKPHTHLFRSNECSVDGTNNSVYHIPNTDRSEMSIAPRPVRNKVRNVLHCDSRMMRKSRAEYLSSSEVEETFILRPNDIRDLIKTLVTVL